MATGFTVQALKTELDTDPLTLGYAALSDGDVADVLNDKTLARPVDRIMVDSDEVIDAIAGAEWGGLATDDLISLQILTARDQLKVSGSNIRAILLTIFGPAGQFSVTRANLAALQVTTGSRAEELWGEFFKVTPTQVAQARAL